MPKSSRLALRNVSGGCLSLVQLHYRALEQEMPNIGTAALKNVSTGCQNQTVTVKAVKTGCYN